MPISPYVILPDPSWPVAFKKPLSVKNLRGEPGAGMGRRAAALIAFVLSGLVGILSLLMVIGSL